MCRRIPALLAMITIALLEGCGGGGGGSGVGGAPNPLITFSSSSLSAAAATNALVPDPGTTPLTVNVDYVVSDNITQSGPNGYTLRFVNLPNSNTFAVDSTRGLVDVVQSDSSGAIITSVQPSTGAVVSKTSGVNARLVLRLTDDGTHAYSASVGGVVRLKVPDWTVDTIVPFELNQFGENYGVSDIQIIPGTSDSFVASRTYGGAYGIPADVVAYDAAIKRSNSVIGVAPVVWTDFSSR